MKRRYTEFVGINILWEFHLWQRYGFVLIVTKTYTYSHSLTYLLTYVLSYLHTYLLTYLLTYVLSYLRTYLLTAWSRALLEKLTGLQLVKKFPAFYGTRRFITALTSVRHLSLSWASSIQSIPPHLTSWRSNQIVSSLLRVGLPSGLFPSGFPTKILYASPLPIRATCPAHLILLDFFTRTISGEQYRS